MVRNNGHSFLIPLHASTSPEQEALIAELRTQLRLSLDDVTEVMNRCSAFHRTVAPASPDAPPVGRFAATPCGYIHLDLKVLSKLQKQPSYVFVAIDRATRYVWVKVLARRTAATVTGRRRIPRRVSAQSRAGR